MSWFNLDFLKGKQRATAQSNKKKFDIMEDVADVYHGYNYYINYLYEKLIRVFKWENLPSTVPSDALEDYILQFGYGGFTLNPKYGFLAVPCTKYGVGLYPRYEPLAQYCTPLAQGKNLLIGKDIVIIKNNSYQLACDDIVRRYARMLADFDATISILSSNKRMPILPSFPSEESAESYKAVMVANRLGQVDAVLDKNFLQQGTFTAFQNTPNSDIFDVIQSRNEILRNFLEEIGITRANDKRERMVVDEVNANSQLLLFNVSDMLECRVDATKQINALYGLDVRVSLSDEYQAIEQNVVETTNERPTENKESEESENEVQDK